MKRRRILTFVSGLLATLLLRIGFKLVIPTPTNAQFPTLLIAAAASLQEALKEVDPLFKLKLSLKNIALVLLNSL